MVEKIASAVYNDVMGGLSGITSTPTLSIDQLKDEVIEEWLQIIKEYSLKSLIPKKDLLMSLNCIEVDCLQLDKCPSCTTTNPYSKPEYHFEIPQIINDLAEDSIEFIGSTDRGTSFKIYTSLAFRQHKYLRRGAEKPFVYIETTPNSNNLYDGWVFNAPFIKKLSIIAIFKDIRQLEEYGCCNLEGAENYSFIYSELKKRLTEKKLRFYRQFYNNPTPNTQAPK